jgi:hypothetical protein
MRLAEVSHSTWYVNDVSMKVVIMAKRCYNYHNCTKVVRPVEICCPWPRAPETLSFPPAPVLEPLGRGCWMKLTYKTDLNKLDQNRRCNNDAKKLRCCLQKGMDVHKRSTLEQKNWHGVEFKFTIKLLC